MSETEMKKECCGGRGCDENGQCKRKCHPGVIVAMILLLGTFLCSLYVALNLRSEVSREAALRAGGRDNYERVLKEIYDTPDYKEMMKKSIDGSLAESKAMMQEYSQQQATEPTTLDPSVSPEPSSDLEIITNESGAEAPVEVQVDVNPAGTSEETTLNLN